MDRTIVSVDPGVSGLGVATFLDGELMHAGYSGGLGGQVHPIVEVVPGFEEYIEDVVEQLGEQVDLLIVEIPKVYDAAKQKGDQHDLIRLAMVAGALIAAARPYVRAALPVLPQSWKGQVPKDPHVRRTQRALSAQEKANVDLPAAESLHHNVWDGVGLGLWRLKRRPKRRSVK